MVETNSVNRRDRFLIAGCILLSTALAWAYLIHLDRGMMMMSPRFGARDVLFTFTMWAVMMVGMMSPSAAPVLLLFASVHAKTTKRGVVMAVLVFGLGYITIWVAFSAAAALTQWALHHAALLSSDMAASRRVGGAILIAAGIYQLTPAKSACLRHCQSPLGFLMSHWRDGLGGAFRMGLRHGAYCLGCCWALMGVLFVVGVMNLAWVAVLTAFILFEKIGPSGIWIARAGGVIIVAIGIVLVVR